MQNRSEAGSSSRRVSRYQTSTLLQTQFQSKLITLQTNRKQYKNYFSLVVAALTML